MTKPFFRIFLLTMMTLACTISISQERSKINPYVQLYFFKDNDEQRQLKTSLTYSRNRMELPIPGMRIFFYSGSEERQKIGEGITDKIGVSTLSLNTISNLYVDSDGFWTFITEFEGNDTIMAGSSELMIRDLSLNMDLSETDSVKNIILTATVLEEGIEVPVTEELVTIYVPRMFSLLPVGEAILDDEGSATVEFPSDLPGDIEGNITVIAKIDEHPDFGTVEKRTTLNWGIIPESSVPAGHRALWTKTAPKWMIYTLSILLTGVWCHYLYAIISLIRIRRDAKKQRKIDENADRKKA